MPLAGKQLLPRQIAQLGRAHWKDAELVKMVAVCLAESQGYLGAYHVNTAADSTTPASQDCGLMQINVAEADLARVSPTLMTTSTEPSVYEKIAEANVAAAYRLYEEPGPNTGLRRWEPWVSYTEGWATFTAWWVWHQDATGHPVGPWLKTGRYLQRAITGVANYHHLVAKDKTLEECLDLARGYAKAFDVAGELGVSKELVTWTRVPAMPTLRPLIGDGPRPVANQGA